MFRPAFLTLLALPLAGCGLASAAPYDSNDPVHCMAVFGAGASAAGASPLGAEFAARMMFIVNANGGELWLRDITPRSRQLAAQWEAQGDREQLGRLVDACLDKQDSDANFRAAIPALRTQGARLQAGRR